MTETMKDIVSAALELPPPARAFLAKCLMESLDAENGAPLSPAWRKEIQKRCAEIDAGSVELVDADQAIAN